MLRWLCIAVAVFVLVLSAARAEVVNVPCGSCTDAQGAAAVVAAASAYCAANTAVCQPPGEPALVGFTRNPGAPSCSTFSFPGAISFCNGLPNHSYTLATQTCISGCADYSYAAVMTWVADTNFCLLHKDTERQLGVPIVNAEVGAIPSICYQGCVYDMVQTINATYGGQLYRYGTWKGTDDQCASTESNEPIATGDPAGGGGPSCGGPFQPACEGGGGEKKILGYTSPCAAGDTGCAETKAAQGAAALHQMKNPVGDWTSVAGSPLHFPSFAFLSPHASGQRVCAVAVQVPNINGKLHGWLGGDNFNLSFCNYTADIDRIGGFLLYCFTALVLWALWRHTPGT